MRQLLVSDFVPPVKGGLEFHVDGLAAELARLGHDVHVATLTRDPALTSAHVSVHTVPSLSWQIPHIDPDRPFTPPVPDPLTRNALGALIRRIKPDVVHGHNWLAASVPKGPRRPPLVYTAHDYALVCELRTLLQRNDHNCSGPRPGKCFSCARSVNGVLQACALGPSTVLGRRLLRPDLVVAVSQHVADSLQQRLNRQIRVIPNFNAQVVPERPEGLPPRFVIYAGSPGDHKGIPELLEVWAADPPAVPLVLAVTQPYDRPLPPRVLHRTWSRAQVRGALEIADVAVVPSRWEDPCPTIALEALTVGTPIVATNVGGLKEIVRDGVEGRLVPPNSSTALAVAIRELLNDEPLRRRMGAAAKDRATDYSVSRIALQVVSAYEEVLETRARRSVP